MSSQPICTAAPARREWVVASVVYSVAAVMVTAFGAFGLDAVFPEFLTDDHAANRWRMGAIFVSVLVLLFAATYRANRLRFYRLFDDRLEIGRRGEDCVRFAEVRRVRIGARPPEWVRTVGRVNATIGKVRTANANAAENLAWQYARTIVFDLGEDEHVVINLSTVDGGEALLAALEERLAAEIESPPSYTEEELAAFGRFVPRRYHI